MPHFADFRTSLHVGGATQGGRCAPRVMGGERRERVRTEHRDDLLTVPAGTYDVAPGGRLAGQQRAVRTPDRNGPQVARKRAQIGDRLPGRERGHLRATPEWPRMPLSRIAWLTTVLLAIVTGIVLLIDSYTGYGVLAFVVGAAAAINLR